MSKEPLPPTKHFTLTSLAEGVFACIHQPGGAAFSNAGIIDLGERTLVVDTLHTRAAGLALRQNAEALFGRPIETAILTHAHQDHWMGACALEAGTTLLTSKTAGKAYHRWTPIILEDFQNPSLWEGMLQETEQALQTEKDERVRAGHEHMLSYFRYALAERTEFQIHPLDQTFEDKLVFQGSKRTAELHSLGPGHSEDDSVVLLPQEGIAFIGDIGLFDAQPYLSVRDLSLLRKQMQFLLESNFETLVPGHGPVGGKAALRLQLQYIDVLEELVLRVVQKGGSYEQALQISLPEPFDKWLMGGMNMFEGNVRSLFKRAGGVVPEAS